MSSGRHHYSKKTAGSSPYSFWVNAISKTKSLSQKNPNDDIKIIPAKSLGKEDQLESLKAPDGQEYAIVSSATPRQSPSTSTQWTWTGEMPYEFPSKPDDEIFKKEKEAYIKKFHSSQLSGSATLPTYILGEGHSTLFMDANDPEVFKKTGMMAGEMGRAFTEAVTIDHNRAPESIQIAWFRGRIKELQAATPALPVDYVKIGNAPYSVERLKAIMNIFRKGRVSFYVLSVDAGSRQNLAVSDCHGHFILLAPKPEAEGPELFV